MSKFKVYLFYLKTEEDYTLYAFTIDKEYKKRFLSQRNKKCFYVDTRELDDIEYKVFSNKYHMKMLVDIPLNYDKNNYTMILATYEEENNLIQKSNELDDIMDMLHKNMLSNAKLKTKYKKSIEYLTKTSYLKNNNMVVKDSISTINLLFLFSKLFENTFMESEDR